MYDKHFVTYEEKAKFYNKIYEPLHPCYDPKTRIYHKSLKDNDFEFKDGKLHYGKLNDLNFDRADEVFPGFNDVNNEKKVQEKISYYLNNNIVPGFCAENYDNFKKKNIFESKEILEPDSYITDKTHNIKKDDLSVYNEKFFLEKEIDKKRQKNEAEKGTGKPPA